MRFRCPAPRFIGRGGRCFGTDVSVMPAGSVTTAIQYVSTLARPGNMRGHRYTGGPQKLLRIQTQKGMIMPTLASWIGETLPRHGKAGTARPALHGDCRKANARGSNSARAWGEAGSDVGMSAAGAADQTHDSHYTNACSTIHPKKQALTMINIALIIGPVAGHPPAESADTDVSRRPRMPAPPGQD